MNLHRVSKQAEWTAVPVGERNRWQAIAQTTRGIVTPGNFFTLLGFGLAGWGLALLLRHEYWPGLIFLVIARLLDIVDGYAADWTGTKTPLGEALDALIDKLVTGLTIIAIAVVNPYWIPALLLLVGPQVVIAVTALKLRREGRQLHPSKAGKLSMLLVWLTLVAILVGLTTETSLSALVITTAAYSLAGASAALGFKAFLGYRRTTES